MMTGFNYDVRNGALELLGSIELDAKMYGSAYTPNGGRTLFYATYTSFPEVTSPFFIVADDAELHGIANFSGYDDDEDGETFEVEVPSDHLRAEPHAVTLVTEGDWKVVLSNNPDFQALYDAADEVWVNDMLVKSKGMVLEKNVLYDVIPFKPTADPQYVYYAGVGPGALSGADLDERVLESIRKKREVVGAIHMEFTTEQMNARNAEIFREQQTNQLVGAHATTPAITAEGIQKLIKQMDDKAADIGRYNAQEDAFRKALNVRPFRAYVETGKGAHKAAEEWLAAQPKIKKWDEQLKAHAQAFDVGKVAPFAGHYGKAGTMKLAGKVIGTVTEFDIGPGKVLDGSRKKAEPVIAKLTVPEIPVEEI